MGKSSAAPRLTVGIASILCIFAVLCLSVFAALAVSTAAAQQKLAQRYAQSVTDYYAADTLCSDYAARFAALSPQQRELSRLQALCAETGAVLTAAEEGFWVDYQVPIDESQALCVRLLLTPEKTEVLRWITVFTAQWTADDTLELWDGVS